MARNDRNRLAPNVTDIEAPKRIAGKEMTLGPMPIFRAAHLFPYLELLRKIGAPVERGRRQARLPTVLTERPEAYLPMLRTLDFLTEMARSQNIDDFAFRAREHAKIEELCPTLQHLIYSAPTLKTALEAIFRLTTLENTHLDIWMASEKSEIRICNRYRIHFDALRTRHCELGANVVLSAIIRAFAGPTWRPEEMGFQSHIPLGRYASERLSHTRLLIGQKTAWIALPRSMLSLPPRLKRNIGGSQSTIKPAIEKGRDFVDLLKLALKSYLSDGYPHIELAAEIAGTSVRTLQRGLRQRNLSYSSLVHQAQFESAVELLKDPDISTLDIAYAVGYEDPSNFARAFRRIAGVSPREYRSQYQYPEN